MAWESYIERPRIPSIRSDHLHENPTNGTGATHLGIHRQFHRIWLDTQGVLQPSERTITQFSIILYWMDTRQ